MAGALSGAALSALVGDPFGNPSSWDAITVSGRVWTGKVEVRGACRRYRWQTKSARGQEGAANTYQGDTPQPFEIEFYIWTPQQYATWLSFVPLFKYSGVKGVVVPVPIYHPALATVNITAIVCDQLGIVEARGEDKLYSVKVKVHEFVPPLLVDATKTPVAAVQVIPPASVGAGASAVSAVLPSQHQAAIAQGAALGIKTALPF